MTQLIQRFLGSGDALARLRDHAARLRRLQTVLEQHLPPALAAACSVANLKGDTLVLLAHGGAVAARLKQIAPTLAEQFAYQIRTFLPVTVNWVESWLDYYASPGREVEVLFVYYDELRREPLRYIRRITDFHGVRDVDESKIVVPEPGKMHFRKGEHGTWREEFTPADQRLADDLIAAVEATNPTGDAAEALAVLKAWDRTAAPESRGAVLFVDWYDAYYRESGSTTDERNATAYAIPWTAAAPITTPDGLGDPARAVATFAKVAGAMKAEYGRMDPAWGDLVRVRRGDVDVPVGGCSGFYGCFRVLGVRPSGDGKFEVAGGDGWVLAVELTNPPRAYSVLAYGQSSKPDSPHHADQAALFARGEMKRVAYLREDVERQAVRRYRPGLE